MTKWTDGINPFKRDWPPIIEPRRTHQSFSESAWKAHQAEDTRREYNEALLDYNNTVRYSQALQISINFLAKARDQISSIGARPPAIMVQALETVVRDYDAIKVSLTTKWNRVAMLKRKMEQQMRGTF